jgi:hypothetical protein
VGVVKVKRKEGVFVRGKEKNEDLTREDKT